MASRSLINEVKHTKFFYNVYYYFGSLFIRILKSFLKPNEKLIAFSSSSGKSYDDSPKAIYEGMLSDPRYDEFEFVWYFRNPEKHTIQRGTKIKTDTLRYYTTLLQARLWITNVSMYRGLNFTGIHTFIFNTWHGSAIKKIGIDVKEGGGTFISKNKKRGDVMLAQGSYDIERFSHAYVLPKDNVIAIGFPRNDELVYGNNQENIERLRRIIGVPQGKKVILYAPTFRDYMKDGHNNSVFDIPVHFEDWKHALEKDYILLFRAHPGVVKVLNLGEDSFVKDVSSYPHVNDLMLVSDILISDYSSIFFDYSILGRPMFCFAYDYDRYDKERGLYFDIRQELKSEILDEENKLLDAIVNMDVKKRVEIAERFRDKYVQEYGSATSKSLDLIYDEIKK